MKQPEPERLHIVYKARTQAQRTEVEAACIICSEEIGEGRVYCKLEDGWRYHAACEAMREREAARILATNTLAHYANDEAAGRA